MRGNYQIHFRTWLALLLNMLGWIVHAWQLTNLLLQLLSGRQRLHVQIYCHSAVLSGRPTSELHIVCYSQSGLQLRWADLRAFRGGAYAFSNDYAWGSAYIRSCGDVRHVWVSWVRAGLRWPSNAGSAIERRLMQSLDRLAEIPLKRQVTSCTLSQRIGVGSNFIWGGRTCMVV